MLYTILWACTFMLSPSKWTNCRHNTRRLWMNDVHVGVGVVRRVGRPSNSVCRTFCHSSYSDRQRHRRSLAGQPSSQAIQFATHLYLSYLSYLFAVNWHITYIKATKHEQGKTTRRSVCALKAVKYRRFDDKTFRRQTIDRQTFRRHGSDVSTTNFGTFRRQPLDVSPTNMCECWIAKMTANLV